MASTPLFSWPASLTYQDPHSFEEGSRNPPSPPQSMVPELKLWKENVGTLEEETCAFPPPHLEDKGPGDGKGHTI